MDETASNQEIMAPEPRAPARRRTFGTELTPMAMLSQAISNGADVEVLGKLMELQARYEAAQGRKAFDQAISVAKGEIPPIVKNRVVDFSSAKGRTHYTYEDLAGIANVVDPILHKHGLNYRFRSRQEGNRVTITCVLSHRDGYSEETELSATEDHTGNKNGAQAIASTATYLQRYTLKLALGLSVTDDDDGRGGGAPTDEAAEVVWTKPMLITASQEEELFDLIEKSGADKTLFLKHFKIDGLGAMPAADYGRAKGMLEKRMGQRMEKSHD